MSVSGQSATSLSAPRPFRRDCPVAAEFRSLNGQAGLSLDPRVPDLLLFPHAPVAEAFFAAKHALFPDSALEVNRRQLAAGCVSNLRAETEEDWLVALNAIRESLGDEPATQRGSRTASARRVPHRAGASARPARLGRRVPPSRCGRVRGRRHRRCDRALRRILNYRRHGARLDGRNRSEAMEIAELQNPPSRWESSRA